MVFHDATNTRITPYPFDADFFRMDRLAVLGHAIIPDYDLLIKLSTGTHAGVLKNDAANKRNTAMQMTSMTDPGWAENLAPSLDIGA
jgi:hypothetical protein